MSSCGVPAVLSVFWTGSIASAGGEQNMGKCLGWVRREELKRVPRPLGEKMGLITYDSFP